MHKRGRRKAEGEAGDSAPGTALRRAVRDECVGALKSSEPGSSLLLLEPPTLILTGPSQELPILFPFPRSAAPLYLCYNAKRCSLRASGPLGKWNLAEAHTPKPKCPQVGLAWQFGILEVHSFIFQCTFLNTCPCARNCSWCWAYSDDQSIKKSLILWGDVSK